MPLHRRCTAIERVPGIGRKGAQRMILELAKLNDYIGGTTYCGHIPARREQLTSALVSLGFSPKESDAAISPGIALSERR